MAASSIGRAARALLRHPAVLEAAAVGVPDGNDGQETLACVVLGLPKGPSGKVQRLKLLELVPVPE